MAQLKSPMDIFKLLDKSNCKACFEQTCLAFAAAVYRGKRKLHECPHMDSDAAARFHGKTDERLTMEQSMDDTVKELKRKIIKVDLASSAQRLGGEYFGERLTLKVLGKDVSIDSKGNISSDIHTHPWVTIPLLSYILHSNGVPISGQWVPFRELRSGGTWYRLFEQRCEKPLKRIADRYTRLFEDMIHIFNGSQVETHDTSDISLVLYPLPKVPILICYWKPEDELASDLNVFFDSTAEDNLNIESIFALGTGLVRMFEKIAMRHGID